jgi:hypothetical protein
MTVVTQVTRLKAVELGKNSPPQVAEGMTPVTCGRNRGDPTMQKYESVIATGLRG